MANFEELKQKAKDTMETIADRSVEFYKIAEEKTKLYAKITKLGAEIALEKGTVRKLYREIGKKYYELHKSSPEDALAQTCTEVTSSLDTIAAKQKEIEALKNTFSLGDKENSEDDPEEKDVEVEIIIEDLEKPVQDAAEPVKNPNLTMEETDPDEDDLISKNPPEFKI
jgi:FtsZ-binding cell division protein ZapB